MKGEHQLRDLIKGKNGEFDLAAESLAYQGYITNELAGKGKAWRNAITEAGRAHLDERATYGHDKDLRSPNAGHGKRAYTLA